MTDMSRTSSPNTTNQPNTNTETQHDARQTNEDRERDPRTRRSIAAHLGILIDGSGPASGRPQPTLCAVDLAVATFKIVAAGRWSPW
ncbi:hypothetical protein GCM10017691_63290 [Pseudonocardia petroleophila]|uniref:Uncharacterized protein n=1 Tax=Pseudonocardia petroleophila TaxID=37331 RepID=A0A7G7MLQ9_9PSEU|nr:hypothetical protein [Pseudonocardia petroleophila]QNG53720.1 hypothetical protein H6H00_07215 [Pseudonocardia petroleophila]